MTDTEHQSIELDEATYERFEKRRKATETDGAPAMSPKVYLQSLLDTEKAVQEGYYDE